MTEQELLLAYYGDDFTGSTDALEFLSRAGAKTVLFIEPPSIEQLKRYQGLRAIGVAGRSRAMTPQEMEDELVPAFEALKTLKVPHVHYKVCSTFDSSPAIGSIGKAIDLGTQIFNTVFVPLLVAAPALGRYCTFGNLFARLGIGSHGAIHRLDRHPSMSRHPVTPMDESDLRLHLSRQTSKKTGLVDILEVNQGKAQMKEKLVAVMESGAEVVMFDALYKEQMENIGSTIDDYAEQGKTLFSVGSSGIEMALGDHWTKQGLLNPPSSWADPGSSGQVMVASGSCSPVTSGQIAWALQHGFAEIALDTEEIATGENAAVLLESYAERAAGLFREGKSVILHTSRGADDERIGKSNKVISTRSAARENIKTSDLYGTAIGRIVRSTLEKISVKRIVIAGGDTSSYAARAMGIEAVEMIAPLTPGAPLCRAFAPGSPLDGLEVNFKGGQVGGESYFGMVREGKSIN